MPRTDFVHLHNHTENSLLDGLGSVDDYVERAKALGQPAIGIMDHGNICGAPQFYAACRKAGIEPIIGEEFYWVPDASWRPEKGSGERIDIYHAGIIARGRAGVKVLSELSTEAHRNFYQKPLIDKAMIEALDPWQRDQLVVLSGCGSSMISVALRGGDDWVAEHELVWWREQFKKFYIEMMHHGTDFDVKLNKRLMKLATKYEVPTVITNDPHYVVPEDEVPHDCLLAIQTGSDVDDEDRFRFDGDGYYLKSRAEMRKTMKRYGTQVWNEGSRNTIKIARWCQTRIPEWESRSWHIPHYPGTDDADGMLRRMTIRGLKRMGLWDKKEYRQRAKNELKIFEESKIADFMLITADICRFARRKKIPMGPGRGSVCGTLVGYAIGIHKIDPVRYNLSFERFLNPARPKMPDIDTDFGPSRRQEIFDYIIQKYGEENTVHVAAYQTMKIKRAFQSLARAYGMDFQTRNAYSKLLNDDDEGEDVLPEELQEAYPDMADLLERYTGITAGVSPHPAGIIITDANDSMRDLIPEMYIASSKRFVAQYNLQAIEDMGALKEDILSLRTCDTIAECVRLIEEHTGEVIDPDSWIPDEEEGDDEIWKMIADGDVAGVFQMEGPTNQRGAKEVKPKNFEDVVSITSLYRTGPIKAGFPKMFLDNRRKGKKNIEYATPLLKPILETTWGVILYQEQVMEIGAVLAGFDMALVDDIKEAIKKKSSAKMDELKPKFIEGCKKVNRIPESISEAIWKQIEGYAGYSYNRSHAVAYTMTSYQTARLKRFYPMYYITALLRTVDKKNTEKREWYLTTALRAKLKVLPPDINISDAHAVPDPERRAIRFGLQDVKGVGEAACKKIEAGKPKKGYRSVEEVAEAVRNSGTIGFLKDASVFESLGVAGDRRRTEELLGWTFEDDMRKYRKKFKSDVRLPSPQREDCRIVGQIVRATKDHTKNGKPYMNWRVRYSLTDSFHVRLWSETATVWKIPEGSIVMITGDWSERWGNISVSDPARVRLVKRARSAA